MPVLFLHKNQYFFTLSMHLTEEPKKVHQGVDLASGESMVFTDDIPEFFSAANDRVLSTTVNIIGRNQDSVLESLLKNNAPQDDPDPNAEQNNENQQDLEIPSDAVIDTMPRSGR